MRNDILYQGKNNELIEKTTDFVFIKGKDCSKVEVIKLHLCIMKI